MRIFVKINTTPTAAGDTIFGVTGYTYSPVHPDSVQITPMGSGRIALDFDSDDEYYAAADQALAAIGYERTTRWGGGEGYVGAELEPLRSDDHRCVTDDEYYAYAAAHQAV